MRKDTTKKFLMRENRFGKRMTSQATSRFIGKKMTKNQIDEQKDYDLIEFGNTFSVKKTASILNISNKPLISGEKERNIVSQNNKIVEFNMVYCDWEYQLHYKLENGFFIGETLVTQELYELVMGENPSLHKDINKYPNAPKHPIENVSWYEAIIFCNKLSEMNKLDNCYTITNIEKEFIKLYNQTQITADVSFDGKKNGYRLPFLDEWTYAARAGTKNKYPGTNVLSAIEDYMWTLKNSKNQTHPVAMKKPNEWGIYDMLGNVKEWSQQGLENATNRKYVRTIGYNDQPYDTEKDYISDLSSLAKEQKSNATGFRIVRNF